MPALDFTRGAEILVTDRHTQPTTVYYIPRDCVHVHQGIITRAVCSIINCHNIVAQRKAKAFILIRVSIYTRRLMG